MIRWVNGALVGAGIVVAASGAMTGAARAQETTSPQWLSNVYLRLDSGASFSSSANRSFGGNHDMGDSYIAGGGIGYRFLPNWRTDFTLGYRGSYGFGQRLSSFGNAQGTADVDALVGMANVYYDIGTFAGFTPYVGGGIGFSDNHVGRTNLGLGPTGARLNGHDETDFAWQLGAGVSYPITPRVALDFGYRYMDMGEMRSGNIQTVNGGASTTVTPLRGDLQAHEVQVGLRYNF